MSDPTNPWRFSVRVDPDEIVDGPLPVFVPSAEPAHATRGVYVTRFGYYGVTWGDGIWRWFGPVNVSMPLEVALQHSSEPPPIEVDDILPDHVIEGVAPS